MTIQHYEYARRKDEDGDTIPACPFCLDEDAELLAEKARRLVASLEGSILTMHAKEEAAAMMFHLDTKFPI